MYCIRVGSLRNFTFADEECDGLLVLTCTVAVRTEVNWIGHRATPGCPMDERRAGLAGGTAFPTSQGTKTSEAARLPEARRDVTMLVIPRNPEHQELTYVYSDSVVRIRSALLREA